MGDGIKILVTGGTMDKMYDHIKGELTFNSSNVNHMLQQARATLEIEPEVLMLKDSLFMNDSDRKAILEKCVASNEKRILITHGTDTMAETAKVLGENINDKTIVLTGAMVPYSFGNSDALFNIGCALTAVQTLPNGVYIIMNGKIFSWNNVTKNKTAGEFEELS